METLRKVTLEAKARAARAEAEAALQAAAGARLDAQVQRLRARQEGHDELEEQLKQERRKLQREVSSAVQCTHARREEPTVLGLSGTARLVHVVLSREVGSKWTMSYVTLLILF